MVLSIMLSMLSLWYARPDGGGGGGGSMAPRVPGRDGDSGPSWRLAAEGDAGIRSKEEAGCGDDGMGICVSMSFQMSLVCLFEEDGSSCSTPSSLYPRTGISTR